MMLAAVCYSHARAAAAAVSEILATGKQEGSAPRYFGRPSESRTTVNGHVCRSSATYMFTRVAAVGQGQGMCRVVDQRCTRAAWKHALTNHVEQQMYVLQPYRH